MADFLTIFTNSFVTLFVVIDPIGLVPIFIAVTAGMDKAERRRVALMALALSTGILTAFAIFGGSLLEVIGISMPAFRVAGGLLLFLTAIEMLFEKRTERREKNSSAPPTNDPSVFPLTIPLLAGPGAITTVVLLMDRYEGSIPDRLAVYVTLLSVLASAAFAFFIAGYIGKIIGRTGTVVISRLLGMLLAALSIQFILDGLANFDFVK